MSVVHVASTPENIASALRIARNLIDAGIPVFAAPPCPGSSCSRIGHRSGKFQYDLPSKWQLTVPSHVWLERWQPGWALAAVGGHRADFLDEDPRNGGTASIDELKAAGHMPRLFGVQRTPSGGFHYVISPLGERETNAFMPGLDYQGGQPDGKGRAFIWIAPTVRRSKVPPYAEVPYEWLQEPDLEYLQEFTHDDSIEPLRDRIVSCRVVTKNSDRERQVMERRAFTEEEAQRFCGITLERLEAASVGEIEEAANNAACQLSHFVPEFWSEEFAYLVLLESLKKTAYDPGGPSEWTADKFHAVIAGEDGRAPDDWEAVRKPETVQEVTPEASAVDLLLAEMLKPSEVIKRPPPKPLVRGLLNLDSESWIIGAPGSKKSFVALDLAGHVARGMPWQGLKVTQARVVMIVAEGAGGLGPRLSAWEQVYGAMGDDHVYILPRPVQAASLGAWAVLVEACRRIGPGLVVLDTQARMTVGLEENSATDMGIFIQAVSAIREATSACVLTVHHTGRAGGDARGSSAIDGAQSTELKVTSEKGSLVGTLASEKQKDLALADDLPLNFKMLTVGEDDEGFPITSLVLLAPDAYVQASGQERPDSWVLESTSVREMVIRVLSDHGFGRGLTKAEVRGVIVERFFGNVTDRLKKATWQSSWNRAIEDDSIINVGGERFSADPVVIEAARGADGGSVQSSNLS